MRQIGLVGGYSRRRFWGFAIVAAVLMAVGGILLLIRPSEDYILPDGTLLVVVDIDIEIIREEVTWMPGRVDTQLLKDGFCIDATTHVQRDAFKRSVSATYTGDRFDMRCDFSRLFGENSAVPKVRVLLGLPSSAIVSAAPNEFIEDQPYLEWNLYAQDPLLSVTIEDVAKW